MKIEFNGYRIKFKKANAKQVFEWLSALVHIVAAVSANHEKAGPSGCFDDCLFPDFVTKVLNADNNEARYFCVYPENLPELKQARRKVAAVVLGVPSV